MDISGIWYNELGSTMTIGPVVDDAFEFNYKTAVSTKNCANGEFKGSGWINTSELGQTIAFSVSWMNASSQCSSVTAWSGQIQGSDDDAKIIAFWMLTGIDPKNDWAPTSIGEDNFSRTQPSDALISEKLKSKRHSHA